MNIFKKNYNTENLSSYGVSIQKFRKSLEDLDEKLNLRETWVDIGMNSVSLEKGLGIYFQIKPNRDYPDLKLGFEAKFELVKGDELLGEIPYLKLSLEGLEDSHNKSQDLANLICKISSENGIHSIKVDKDKVPAKAYEILSNYNQTHQPFV